MRKYITLYFFAVFVNAGYGVGFHLVGSFAG